MTTKSKGGRPRGSKVSMPELGILQQRKVMLDIQRRALEGSPEDQRLLLVYELCNQMLGQPREEARTDGERMEHKQAPIEQDRASWKPREFMARHEISHATFWRWVRDDKIKVVRHGRVVRVPASEDARIMSH